MRKSKGFSLFEVLIVLAIIAGIAGLAVSNLDKIFGSSKEQMARIFVNETIKVPLVAYAIGEGKYPSTADGLKALLEAPDSRGDRWKGPYVDSLPKDPWGNDYCYACPGTHNREKYDVWSNGSPGGDEKIGNW